MSRKRHDKTDAVKDDPLFNIRQAASMTECTGILPAQTETPEERRTVAALGAIHAPEND